MTPREICIMKVGNIPGYRGHVSTSKQIEYDVQRYKQRVDKVEKKACEAEKKACDAEKKADELAKKADEAKKRSSQMNDEIIMLREKQALLEDRLESMMDMFTQLEAQPASSGFLARISLLKSTCPSIAAMCNGVSRNQQL
ncbi:Major outer membrane lipoprotein Oprl [Dillenia turbinata]|uniref:Major outer membrane lipoprotein Oprl n=1 Tax=Dillenia turbinata TaxID=194707 RepID=A0AAN8VDE7_9MAGN